MASSTNVFGGTSPSSHHYSLKDVKEIMRVTCWLAGVLSGRK
jgi:hypothetical protein